MVPGNQLACVPNMAQLGVSLCFAESVFLRSHIQIRINIICTHIHAYTHIYIYAERATPVCVLSQLQIQSACFLKDIALAGHCISFLSSLCPICKRKSTPLFFLKIELLTRCQRYEVLFQVYLLFHNSLLDKEFIGILIKLIPYEVILKNYQTKNHNWKDIPLQFLFLNRDSN